MPPSRTVFDEVPDLSSDDTEAAATRRLFGRVAREHLAGIISVRCGDRVCDDLLIDLGPGGMRLRAFRTLTPSDVLEGVTLYRQLQRKGSVRVSVRDVESHPCRENGSDYLAYRAIFTKPLPRSLCADLQAALSQGPHPAGTSR